ncbi:hypothetical protein BH23PAT1_BH23PAT1_3700 [soil metagenome]
MDQTPDSLSGRIKKVVSFTLTVVGLTFFIVLSALAVTQINKREFVEGRQKSDSNKQIISKTGLNNSRELAVLNGISLVNFDPANKTEHEDTGSTKAAGNPSTGKTSSEAMAEKGKQASIGSKHETHPQDKAGRANQP